MGPLRVSILVVEPRAAVRGAFAEYLRRSDQSFEAHDVSPEDLLDAVAATRPDVVLLGIDSPAGVDLLRDVLQGAPACRVIVLSFGDETDVFLAAMNAGASGFLPTWAEPADLIEAVRSVAGGGPAMDPGKTASWLRQVPVQPAPSVTDERTLSRLTMRERQVAELLADGVRPAVIASQLGISVRTVESHLSRIYRKLGVSSRLEAFHRLSRASAGRTRPA